MFYLKRLQNKCIKGIFLIRCRVPATDGFQDIVSWEVLMAQGWEKNIWGIGLEAGIFIWVLIDWVLMGLCC